MANLCYVTRSGECPFEQIAVLYGHVGGVLTSILKVHC